MKPYYADQTVTLWRGANLDVLPQIEDGSIDCVVTSPPYFGLRDYGADGQYGTEGTPAEFVANLVATFAEIRRVLADDGTVWLNLGDSYAGSWGAQGKVNQGIQGRLIESHAYARKASRTGAIREGMPPAKNLIGIPWRVAFALQDDGWILRNDGIWHKTTAMPESVQDRLSNRHEYVFLLAKSRRYFFNLDAIREEPVTTRSTALSWDRTEQGVPGQRPQHRPGRPQRARAEELARQHGLTEAHLEAIRAVGMSDAGKAAITQNGRNRPEIRALADEAKAALGGYYREFLTPAGKNPGDVLSFAAEPFPGAHFATFPSALPRFCIRASCKPGGTVLDPFHGSGTTGMVAQQEGCRYVGIDINQEYLDLSLKTRLHDAALDFGSAS